MEAEVALRLAQADVRRAHAALVDAEKRKRDAEADITRLRAELAACQQRAIRCFEARCPL